MSSGTVVIGSLSVDIWNVYRIFFYLQNQYFINSFWILILAVQHEKMSLGRMWAVRIQISQRTCKIWDISHNSITLRSSTILFSELRIAQAGPGLHFPRMPLRDILKWRRSYVLQSIFLRRYLQYPYTKLSFNCEHEFCSVVKFVDF